MITPRIAIIYQILNHPETHNSASLLTLDPMLFRDMAKHYEWAKEFVQGSIPKWDESGEETLLRLISPGYYLPARSQKELIADLIEDYKDYRLKNAHFSSEQQVKEFISELDKLKAEPEGSIKETLEKFYEDEAMGRTRGVNTGIPFIDEITVGLKRGHFWILGGYTNVGKTTVMCDMILRTARDHRTVMFSLEMTQYDLVGRLLHGARTMGFRDGLDHDKVGELQLDIVTSARTLSDIETYLGVMADKPEIVWVDFIQNVKTDDRGEYERMTNVAIDLQDMAKRHNCCVIGLSQVSNESANTNQTTMGFKGSGAIAAACDVGIEIARIRGSKEAEEELEIIPLRCEVRKNRHGRTGGTEWDFNRKLYRISY